MKEVQGISTMMSLKSSKYCEEISRGVDSVIPKCSLSDLVLAQIKNQCIKLRKVRKVKQKRMVKKMKGMWCKMKPSSPWSIVRKVDNSIVHEKRDRDAIAKKSYGEPIGGRIQAAHRKKGMRSDTTGCANKTETLSSSKVNTEKGSYTSATNNESKKANMIPKSALSLNVLSDLRGNKKSDFEHPQQVKKKVLTKSKTNTYERRDLESNGREFVRTRYPPSPPPTSKQRPIHHLQEHNERENIGVKFERMNRNGEIQPGYTKTADDEEQTSIRPCLEGSTTVCQPGVDKEASRHIEVGKIIRMEKQFNTKGKETKKKNVGVMKDVDGFIGDSKMKGRDMRQFTKRKETFEKELSLDTHDNKRKGKTGNHNGKILCPGPVDNLKRPRPRPPPPPPRRKQNPQVDGDTTPISSSKTGMIRTKRSQENQRSNDQPKEDFNNSSKTKINSKVTSVLSETQASSNQIQRPKQREKQKNESKENNVCNKSIVTSAHVKIKKSPLSSSVLSDIRVGSNQLKSASQQVAQNDDKSKQSVFASIQARNFELKKPSDRNQLKSHDQQVTKNDDKGKQSLFASIQAKTFELKKPSDRVKEPASEKITIFSEIKKGKALRKLSQRLLQVKEKTKSKFDLHISISVDLKAPRATDISPS
jgi:hypothetical protein